MTAVKNRRSRVIESRLAALLGRHGYRMDGSVLVSVGVAGFTSDDRVGRFRDVWHAAEWACPVVRDPAFTAELAEITAPAA
jgi:hypothetical protein